MEDLDFDARYSVKHMPGIAFYLVGYVTEWQEYVVDVYDDYDDVFILTDFEEVEDRNRVIAIMVGDDYKHIVDVDDLTKIDDDDYCSGCGQIGCGHGG